MSDFCYIIKDGKYLTSGAKFTDNINLAYLYDDQEKAEYIAKSVGGQVVVRKSKKWVVVKDGMYLSNNGRFVQDIKEAYFFNKSIADQYAQELKGNAVQVLTK